MHSIRTKFTLLTVSTIIAAMSIATLIGAASVKDLGSSDAEKMLLLMCRTGEMNLESYFDSVEHSVKTVSILVQESMEGMPYDQLDSQVERARNLFGKVAYQTNGVLTYYFRIDPEISETVKGFWYVNLDGEGFREHEVTDISLYDTEDTSKLVWFTVPKATGKGIWLPPYYTDNLDVCVISYNVPVYWNGRFLGVIGIEIDYATLSHEVENIRLYDNGYAFLMDAEGNFIYHPYMDTEAMVARSMSDPPEGLFSDSRNIRYRYEGVDKKGVWLPLRNGMRLYVTVPVAEIDDSWRGLIRNMFLASLVVLGVVSTVVMSFSEHLTEPLRKLTEAAVRADHGDYDFALDYDKDDEVGILTRTFRQLASHTEEHISNLNRKAYVDALTSVRNKGAYVGYIQKLQEQMDASDEPPAFAVGVFDCDDLKSINDTYGHDKGDVYLKTASRLICRIYQHSPVFRIGGDEFAVVLQNEDYRNRNELYRRFREARAEICAHAENPWDQVRVTLGLAEYDPRTDAAVIDVARRADRLMYENKRHRKEEKR